jgi:hypothetical protein
MVLNIQEKKMSDTPREGFVWVLDAASGDVFRLVAPEYWDSLDSEEMEDWLQASIPRDIRLKDCNWQFTYNPVHYVLEPHAEVKGSRRGYSHEQVYTPRNVRES